jgi:molecular chaperone HtpG
MTETVQKQAFQAEVQEVLNLMVHSLYSNKEIFLRELISNASDACDKLRFRALKDDALMEGDAELAIEIEVDEEKRLLTIRDNGIGMSRQEVIDNIGTIARSGTRQFLQQARADGEVDSQLIGQFGVGFYSAFIVADHVTLLTRQAGAAPGDGVRWESDGSGEFSIREIERPHHGTEVILHLKEGEDEFLQAWTLRSLINRYSDHIGFPIRMRESVPPEEEGGEPTVEWKTVNQASALWTLPRAEISDEDYESFYQHVSHDFDKPLAWAHNQVEGSQNYTSLLYVPSQAPLDFLMQRDERKGLKLYVKRVFIMDAAEELLPHYLRFVRGVVDSDDLPLNVSREILQENELVRKIRAAVVRRSLDLLGKLAKDEPEKFATFWGQFGTVLKEGIVEDTTNRERVAGLLRFTSTQDVDAGQVVSLADYMKRAGERVLSGADDVSEGDGDDAQEETGTIWYITAESLNAAKNSPHLEVFRRKGIEVLLLHDRIDEWMMGYFTEYQGWKLRSVAKGDLDLDEADQETETPEEQGELLERMKTVLGESVSAVRASRRLTDSAACLVLGEHDMALHLKRMLEQAGQQLPESKPSLEVNLGHPLLEKLASTEDEKEFAEWTRFVHEQAILSEGGQLDDPAAFVQRLNRLVLAGD